VPWILVAWLLVVVSGALATSLSRAPVVNPAVVADAHRVLGAGVGLFAVGGLVWLGGRRRNLGAVLAAAVMLTGWLADRSFAPRIAAAHAALAGFGVIAAAGLARSRFAAQAPARQPDSPGSGTAAWVVRSARIAAWLVLAQIASGALLRHHLMSLTWHLLLGGAAVIALLVPAVAIAQDESAPAVERRAAGWAIAATIAQASLGVAVLIMLFVGAPSVAVWLAATIAHVAVGSLTLLSVWSLVRVLRRRSFVVRDPPAHRDDAGPENQR
jgi:hypothetical protein